MRIDEKRRNNISRMIKKGLGELSGESEAESRDTGIRNFEELLDYANLTELSEDAGFNKSTLHKKLFSPDKMKIEECVQLAAILNVTPQQVMSLALNGMKWKPAKKSV
ncbi:hypothetical protein HF324_16855 [Chitinophaga oryzae]|uniref:XRE family transcriptional regulator n=2 Tax=Chitinophaga oryzae TaxID=2725414 RepID=A0ABX6LH56_9BACT|nr:hypothetical protein [Chitinophaga oryzae]QJB39436.1 hypothetical protein HF324_16855 [Chitinophaga oryzae]